jgi:NAD(P)-dependent dehydrogenase (short-subunit alcohol dehydrogenase family)
MSDQRRGVVITGAAGDLGRDLAESFLRDGYVVFGADVMPQPPIEGLVAVTLDVTDRAAVFALAARAATETRMESWINAAGIFLTVPVPVASEADWQRIIAVNLSGVFHGCAAALDVLSRAGSGRIVNIGSVSGQIGGAGVHPAYGASKAGVHSLTKTYALEGARHGVLCNAVAPSLLDGSMSRIFSVAQRERLARTNPLGRMGRVGEVTRVVRFLADLGQTFVNGAVVPVNGGSYMPS